MMQSFMLLCLQCVLITLSHGRKTRGQISMDVHSRFTDFHIPEPVRMVLKEKSKHEHRIDFLRGRRSDRSKSHEVIFAVKQRNIDELERILMEVSNPNSRQYGKHKSRKEVSDLTTNHAGAQHILLYLKNQEVVVSKVSKNQDFITANAPVHIWESLFSTEFYEFESVDGSSESVVRALEYSLPEHLAEHVHAVFNTVQLPLINTIQAIVKTESPQKRSPIHTDAGVLLSGYITPQLLSNFYSIAIMNGSDAATQSVYSDGQNYFSPSDLSTFQKTFKLYQNPVETVIGGNNNDAKCVSSPSACGESNLDVQYLMAVAQMSPTTYLHYTGNQAFLGWIQQVADLDDPPLVHSISFGFNEFSGYDSYFDSFNTEAIKLGVMGVTILASSGDDGAVGHEVRDSWEKCEYNPSFPASSPYVTAVGGSMGPETGSTEIVCQTDKGGTITTGGGFSTLFKMPEWQSDAVSSYFSRVDGTALEPFAGYAVGGRGFPDVTLAAENYAIYIGGSKTGVSGTSASCPAFAGMISLVNAKRLAAGKSSLGWINPALYNNSSLFVNDITSGDNKCAVGPTCCSQGFHATDGWDPATGLGSVNFNNMLDMFMSLGDEVLNAPSAVPTPGVTAPTEPPSAAPSEQPTTFTPTRAPGWLSAGLYGQEDCSNPVNVVSSVKTDQCFELYSNGTATSQYVMYTCDAVYGRISKYSDSNCTLLLEAPSTVALGCATVVADDTTNVIGSAQLSCSATTALPVDTAQSYMTQRNYNDADCEDSDISSLTSYLKDTCVNNFGTPTKATLTSLNTYSSSASCSSNSVAVTSETIAVNTCTVAEPSSDDSTDSSTKWTFDAATTTYSPSAAPTTNRPSKAPSAKPTTIAPSMSPSIAPSQVPTHAPTIYAYYKFTVQQLLIGISEARYNANSTLNDLILKHTVAACVNNNGFSYSDVEVKHVLAGPAIDGTARPTQQPTGHPSVDTLIPTILPSLVPSLAPTLTQNPTVVPTEVPSMAPTISLSPSESPSEVPTESPTFSQNPTVDPTVMPSCLPTVTPTLLPTVIPTILPTPLPSTAPTLHPTVLPSLAPSVLPSTGPTEEPTVLPTTDPTDAPTLIPTRDPSAIPSVKPTRCPTLVPSFKPSRGPTNAPTTRAPSVNTRQPTVGPTHSMAPSAVPSEVPSESPTYSIEPSAVPSEVPSIGPTLTFSVEPSAVPSEVPSIHPTLKPTVPTVSPTIKPTLHPTASPSVVPTDAPHLRRRVLSSTSDFSVDSTNVTYVVHFDITALGYDSPEPAYTALTTALQDAVDSGVFNTHLAAFAVQFHGGNMTGVTSSSISVSNYTSDVFDDDNNDDDGGSGNISISEKNLIIIGISIAAGLGMFCVGLMVVLFCNGDATVAPSIVQK